MSVRLDIGERSWAKEYLGKKIKSSRTHQPPGSGGGARGQRRFELATNSDYHSRVPAGTRESLRRCRISKSPLTAHKVLTHPEPGGWCWFSQEITLYFEWKRCYR